MNVKVHFAYTIENTHMSAQELDGNDVYQVAIDSGALSFRLAAIMGDHMEEIELQKLRGETLSIAQRRNTHSFIFHHLLNLIFLVCGGNCLLLASNVGSLSLFRGTYIPIIWSVL